MELAMRCSEDPLKKRDKGKVELDVERQDEQESEPEVPAARASWVFTLAYVLVAIAHFQQLGASSNIHAGGTLNVSFVALQVSLAFEALVYASGGVLRHGWGAFLLESAGRLRLLLGATVWAWQLPWAAELHCRCGEQPAPPTAALAYQQGQSLAYFVSAFFALREVCVLLRGEPPSALDQAVQPRFGDCLPSNAVLGGQFRMDKAEFEQTGRMVFVPSRLRKGLDISSGLALAAHVVAAARLRRTAWLLGALGALAMRRLGGLWDALVPRRGVLAREVPRLLCRCGELCWLQCALWQLQACELSAGGHLPECPAP